MHAIQVCTPTPTGCKKDWPKAFLRVYFQLYNFMDSIKNTGKSVNL